MDEPYPHPVTNELLDKLIGEHFTCVDLVDAFKQVLVTSDKSRKIMALVTPYGYAVPTTLQFGVKTAPKIFQAGMDKLIHGMNGFSPIPSTVCMMDDVCTTGATPQDHFYNLAELLYRLYVSGLKLNKDKCKFYQSEVKFLGKIIDKDGIRLNPDAISAIVNMPEPTDKHTLRSFLGHMSYIGRHIPDLRNARAPLDALLKVDTKFIWSPEHAKAFAKCKKLASNPATLAHYDHKLPKVLITDASPVGVAACLAHKVTVNGKTFLRPLSYASCSLTPAERNYAQIDREGYAVFWGIKHYRQLLLGEHFEVHTDCSALKKIFGPKNDLGGCATGRLNRYAAMLMEFDFTVIHIKGSSNKICDSLSRLPVQPPGQLHAPYPTETGRPISSATLASNLSTKSATFDPIFYTDEIMTSVSCMAQLPDPAVSPDISICKIVGQAPSAAWDILPLARKDVAKATREDRVYGKLLSAVRSGVLNKDDPDMKPFVSMFYDLYVDQDVIYYGSRPVIPTKQQFRLLSELHMTHMGIVKMKAVARQYFWWPLINKEIEKLANSCEDCRKYRRKPTPAPLCPWPYARRPMERVHIDFCEFNSKHILVMVDAFSKYMWAAYMGNDTTTMKTLAFLYSWFCERSGFPTTLVSDNGPQFTSKDFKDIMVKWGIKHILTPPYHPASNGLAERGVGTIKSHLTKMNSQITPIGLHMNLQTILRYYRSTKQASTDQTPYELISKAADPPLFPQLQKSQQQIQEKNRVSMPKDSVRKARAFKIGDNVLVYNTQTKVNSIGVVKDCQSNNSYIVMVNGREKHISSDHMSLLPKDDSDNVNDSSNKVSDDKEDSDDEDLVHSSLPCDDSDDDDEDLVHSSLPCDDSDDDDEDLVHSYLPLPCVDRNVSNVPVPQRKYKSESQKLQDNLSVAPPASRLRSGK